MNYRGAYTALVTPFTTTGEVDEETLRTLVEAQIEGGIDGIVPCGTTGESPTLSHEEHNRVVELVVKFVNGRCKVIAGTGSNSTDEAIQLTREAEAAGASASLQVVPYYNKPTQEGLYQHFRAIAEQGGLPIIIYDIPGRTGVGIALETIVRLRTDLPQSIIGVKEATGTTERIAPLRARLGDEFSILSGDDSLTLPMMSLGADGVISVASNVVPREVREMVHTALDGNFAEARAMNARLAPIFKDLFIETNPIPVKAALAMGGRLQEIYRLPLTPMAVANRARLEETLRKVGYLKK
ncbi:4-hydroxy-tetrahydrodipicolinate synthase [Candidatus Kaiserbacteria bacterium RIFCSPLOWO2_12_FULL_53_8]|uniref:4-hydroxy-tetrahydrodipicolinate synthase n=2 Tax=Candidatus Kaiseribacteriota TaxID=1752734 RepID=A0A1F6CVN1_9BACT|nr:MAG: 4-hydroxy-tetrahydrodipicolinate synthase [Candidatus Kaiserbacteria bacterium RIFCSPHIGHO2_01_FULL_53_29]OGG92334.1 MAG: 4-hydroxy-tetrahydrodipicolinate synthase [Candidatus Kaiserbacteria bacterium RIFCSPLOWO2_12_FULL_53_8]